MTSITTTLAAQPTRLSPAVKVAVGFLVASSVAIAAIAVQVYVSVAFDLPLGELIAQLS